MKGKKVVVMILLCSNSIWRVNIAKRYHGTQLYLTTSTKNRFKFQYGKGNVNGNTESLCEGLRVSRSEKILLTKWEVYVIVILNM